MPTIYPWYLPRYSHEVGRSCHSNQVMSNSTRQPFSRLPSHPPKLPGRLLPAIFVPLSHHNKASLCHCPSYRRISHISQHRWSPTLQQPRAIPSRRSLRCYLLSANFWFFIQGRFCRSRLASSRSSHAQAVVCRPQPAWPHYFPFHPDRAVPPKLRAMS